MMTKFKALYQGMYDDLKDADMMIDYANCIKWGKTEDKTIGDEIAKYAKYRLDHFSTFHKMLMTEMGKVDKKENMVTDALWEQTCKNLIDWHDVIQKKITEY